MDKNSEERLTKDELREKIALRVYVYCFPGNLFKLM
jgi:hypothetical protein